MKISVEILTLTSIKRENSVDKLFFTGLLNDWSFNILKTRKAPSRGASLWAF